MSSDRCETAPREEEGEGDGEEGDEVEGYGGFGGGGGVAGGLRVRCAAGDGENEAEGDEELDEAEGFEGEEGVWGGGGVGCVDAGGWSVPGLEVYYWRALIGWLRWQAVDKKREPHYLCSTQATIVTAGKNEVSFCTASWSSDRSLLTLAPSTLP